MSEHQHGYVTSKQVSDYVIMTPLLNSLYSEFQELSKKKSQEVLNEKKVKLVNRLLTPILEILKDEPTRPFLDLLDDEDLPQNSDVILMLGQFQAAMKSFQLRHYDRKNGWHLEEPD